MSKRHPVTRPMQTPTASSPLPATEPGDRAKVLDFISPPFAVRRNVVKIWRSLPVNLWTALSEPADDAWGG